MRAPHTVVTDWIMADYQGYFPASTRAWQNMKACLLCYVAVPVCVLALVLMVTS